VVFGATVTVYDDESESESTYRIVGEDESDIKQGLISVSSPVANALIGHRVDDEVQVKVPSGIRIYEIIDVKYV
jgi:transcription elongation factor GreA